ncbi:MAG: hypothetical protein V4495_28880, partial [Pseudomonadota bacterium]
MRKLGLILLVALANSSCQKQEAKTEIDSKENQLKRNAIVNEYEQKIAEQKIEQKATAGFLVGSFDHNVNTLQENFKGHDAERVFRALQNLSIDKKIFEKEKYETKSEHQARINSELKKPFYDDVNYETQIAFVIGIHPDYDADKKILEYSVPTFSVHDGIDNSYKSKTLFLNRTEKIADVEAKSNAFGVKALVKTVVTSNLELVMYGNKIPASFQVKGAISMPVSDAKELGQHKIALLIYGKLKNPFYTRGR